MMNIILMIIEIIICYLIIMILNKKYQTDGLYVYAIIASLISCIMNLKQIDILGISVPIGLGITTSLIVTGNIITQKRGKEELKTYIILILITTLASCCFLNLTGLMKASEYNLYANKSYNSIFKYNIRIYIATIISLISSVWLSGNLYYLLKRVKNKILISNIFTIVIVEFIESVLFMLIGFLFTYDLPELILSIIFRYIIKAIIGIIGTIPIYITSKYNIKE